MTKSSATNTSAAPPVTAGSWSCGTDWLPAASARLTTGTSEVDTARSPSRRPTDAAPIVRPASAGRPIASAERAAWAQPSVQKKNESTSSGATDARRRRAVDDPVRTRMM